MKEYVGLATCGKGLDPLRDVSNLSHWPTHVFKTRFPTKSLLYNLSLICIEICMLPKIWKVRSSDVQQKHGREFCFWQWWVRIFWANPLFESQKSYVAGKELGSWAPDTNTQGSPKNWASDCPAFLLQATASLTVETGRWLLSRAFNRCVRRGKENSSPECAKEGGTR